MKLSPRKLLFRTNNFPNIILFKFKIMGNSIIKIKNVIKQRYSLNVLLTTKVIF